MSGTLYPIKIEYKQVVGNATMQLRWSSRSQSKDVVSSNRCATNEPHSQSVSAPPWFESFC